MSETHKRGTIFIENANLHGIIESNETQILKGDFGLQVADDGRVWVCLNGVAFIRFSPHRNGRMQKGEWECSK